MVLSQVGDCIGYDNIESMMGHGTLIESTFSNFIEEGLPDGGIFPDLESAVGCIAILICAEEENFVRELHPKLCSNLFFAKNKEDKTVLMEVTRHTPRWGFVASYSSPSWCAGCRIFSAVPF